MNEPSEPGMHNWATRAGAWITPRRIRAHGIILATCLWGVCIIDYATPGLFDRAGNIKFQDFLQFPISARLIAQGRAAELYDTRVLNDAIRAIVGRDTSVYLQYFYGPQVALPFIPLLRWSFLTQAGIWIGISLALYFGCVYLLWRRCSALRPYAGLVAISAIAYPPLFHFFVRGQLSAVITACFSAAALAFLAQRDWLAGFALGFLAFKPQFLVAIPLVLLLARSWKMFSAVVVSAGTQMALTFLYFGPNVMRSYLTMLLHSASAPRSTELSLSRFQMHSLYSFWSLLVTSSPVVWVLYLASSIAVITITAAIWKSSSSRPVRFSALVLAAVLVNPHIYIYDLVALIPVFVLLADLIVSDREMFPSLPMLLYLAFILPLFGPLARWTHLQLSVPVFAILLWMLWRQLRATVEERRFSAA